jgi:hypothetical protein
MSQNIESFKRIIKELTDLETAYKYSLEINTKLRENHDAYVEKSEGVLEAYRRKIVSLSARIDELSNEMVVAGDELSYLEESKAVMASVMEGAIWDYERKIVILEVADPRMKMSSVPTEFTSYDDLSYHVHDIASSDWTASVPWVDGASIVEFDDSSVDAYLQDTFEEELTKLGWI